MKIKTVLRYVADDGTFFNSAISCVAYEKELIRVLKIMEHIPAWPKEEYEVIQLDKARVWQALNELWELIQENHPALWMFNSEEARSASSVIRTLFEETSPSAIAWHRFSAIDFKTSKMYQQPFFALNPEQVPTAS